MYTGTLSYFAQLQAQHQLSAIAFKANIFPIFNTDPTNPTQAVSRVKALQLANAQGQQIYKIDQTNIDEVLPKLNLSSTIKQDIQSSVNAGKYVITHTDNVSVPGWSGAGYAVIDPLTGSDAYMISGGENGGFLLIISLLMASVGGMFDSYSNKYSEKQPYLNYKRAQIAKVLGRIGIGLAILGVLMTAITLAMDDTFSTADKIGQILVSLLSALMSSMFIAFAAPLLTGPGLILSGAIAATALALGLAVVSMEYFSRITITRRYYAV